MTDLEKIKQLMNSTENTLANRQLACYMLKNLGYSPMKIFNMIPKETSFSGFVYNVGNFSLNIFSLGMTYPGTNTFTGTLDITINYNGTKVNERTFHEDRESYYIAKF